MRNLTALNEQLSTTSPDSAEPFELATEALVAAELKKQRVKELRKLRDSDKGRRLVDFVKNAHGKAKKDRTTEERKWALNLAMYRGQTDLFIYDDPRFPSAHGRIGRLPHNGKYSKKINRIRPVIRTEMARLLSQTPTAYVLPASSEDRDLFAAQAGEQVWKALKERRHLDAQFAKAAFWLTITGTGFLKNWWDPNAVDRDSDMPGDIVFAAPSPFHIFVPDKMEQEIEDQAYIIHAYAKPIEWVKFTYKDELEGVKLAPSHSRGSQIVENSVLGVSTSESADTDSVIIYEAWVKPGANTLVPNGALITVINDVLVQFREGLPYQHGEFPFAKFEHLPTETFYADSVITDLIPLQQEYNEVRSRINETIHKMSSHQLLAAKGSIAAQKITNEIGQVILYNPGLPKPEPMPIQQIPGYVLQALDRSILDMEDISGQHQVSKGSAPPGVTAATAISFLQEKDDSYLVHTYQSIERGMEKVGRQSLTLAVEFWDVPRLVKIIGDDLGFDAQMLAGSQFSSGTDLRTEGGSSLPESKAAKQALVMDLMSQGFIDPNEGLQIMEIGGANRIIDKLKVDERQAQRENMKMKTLTEATVQQFEQMHMQMQQAEMEMLQMQQKNPEEAQTLDADSGAPLAPPPVVPVNTWDNHQVHIVVHNNFRKSQSYELLPEAVKAQFEKHVVLHEQALVGGQMEELLGQMPGDGSEVGSQFDGEADAPNPELDGQIAAAEQAGGMEGSENAAPGPEGQPA